MTKDSCISLIAGAALFVMGSISIASAFDGAAETDNRSDAAITRLDPLNVGINDWQEYVLGSNAGFKATQRAAIG